MPWFALSPPFYVNTNRTTATVFLNLALEAAVSPFLALRMSDAEAHTHNTRNAELGQFCKFSLQHGRVTELAI